MKKKIKSLYDAVDCKEFTTLEFILLVLVALLTGLTVGMLISPRKTSTIGSNNGNNSPGCLTYGSDEKNENEN